MARIIQNFPRTERRTDIVDLVNPYIKEFDANNSSVSLDINLNPKSMPCSVNPPIRPDSYARVKYGGDYTRPETCTSDACCDGTITAFYIVDGIEQIGGYTTNGTSITVPEDGCYYVRIKGGGWGISYFMGAQTELILYHNGSAIASGNRVTTGYIALLGPVIYYTPPVSNLFAVIEAKAGDTISASMNASGFSLCYGWVAGTYLRGSFQVYTSEMEVILIASAENVLASPPEPPLEYPEGTVVDPIEARITLLNPANSQTLIG